MFEDDEKENQLEEGAEPQDTDEGESEGEREGEKEQEGEERDKPKEFLDPRELPPELLPIFKRMQASFTRAMQGASSVKQKAALYDKLMEDEDSIAELAEKHGLKLTKKGEVKEDKAATPEMSDTEKWVREVVKNVINEQLNPTIQSVKKDILEAKVEAAKNYLNENYPDWYLYEDVMAELITKHPTMAADLDNLYEVAKLGSTKAEELKKKSDKSSSVFTKPSKGREAEAAPVSKAKTVEEAFEIAKRKVGLKL